MIRWTLIATLLLFAPRLLAAAESPRRTAMIRYAVIVGSNAGTDPIVGTMPDLQHAEREVHELRDSLVKFANFDPSGARTVLLAGAKRQDVARAIAQVARQVEADKKTFGATRTLFAFFFTGHGLNERLLLSDGPIYAKELADMLQSIKADFTVGFFDACFSGSITEHQLAAKGVRPTPGLNIFRELPEDILSAEGSVWFVSSAPTEASYEDRELGGVFTHFFIEALEHAEADGPGITLERIWSYARKETVLYTTARQRAQTPQEVVTRLKASAPLYFSFPRKRDAKLVLSAGIAGRFLLAYDGGELSEIVHKERGSPLELEVYSGPARLIMIGDGPERAEESIVLVSDATLSLDRGDEALPHKIAEKRRTLWEKGIAGDHLRAQLITRDSLLSLGPAFEFTMVRASTLAPRQAVKLVGRYDNEFFAAGRAGVGWASEQFTTWGYDLSAYSLDLRVGLAFDAAEARIGISAGGEVTVLDQTYRDGATRLSFSFAPTAGLEATLPIVDRVALAFFAEGGVLFGTSAGADGRLGARPIAKFGVMPRINF